MTDMAVEVDAYKQTIDLHITEGYAREIESAARGKSPERRAEIATELRDIASAHPYAKVLRDAADRLS